MKKIPIINIKGEKLIDDWKAWRSRFNLIEVLEKHLPHGSGINYTWSIEDKGSYIKCKNNFDIMNENDYISVVPFSITIPKKKPTNFKLHFHGNQYYANKYNLKDYLESLFYDSMYRMIKSQGNVLEIKKR